MHEAKKDLNDPDDGEEDEEDVDAPSTPKEFQCDAAYATWELKEGAITVSEEVHAKCAADAAKELESVALEFDMLQEQKDLKREFVAHEIHSRNAHAGDGKCQYLT